ncbi:MAG TPA: S-formylglutathione hydrolase [Burkholderiaceae bacterium]|nr:S-formylglutathione hydrolase [Burkholderiaceae bacterium]
MAFELVSSARCFGGEQRTLRHLSAVTGTPMRLAVFLPPQSSGQRCPMVIYLSGLTCTEDNVMAKAGAQRVAAELGLVFVAPDTSPRGDGVPDDAAWELGQGASYYLDARRMPWATHFRMESYLVDELLPMLCGALPVQASQVGLMGHSMGGHGALTLALRHPSKFRSVSALSPIVAPSQVPWGKKALEAYLGEDEDSWREHDACALLQRHRFDGTLRVDQGDADPFYQEQLQTWLLAQRCEEVGQAADIRIHAGYDHSYFFVASFIEEHLRHHAAALSTGRDKE